MVGNFHHGPLEFQDHPDHDACGTGFIVRLGEAASHEVVERALVALRRLSHRGGIDADGSSGDGAGLLTAIPQRFMRRKAESLGIKLPERFGLGMLFLPAHEQQRARLVVESLAPRMGLEFLGWRKVPTNNSALGARAAETLPAVWQCFFAAADGQGGDLEAKLFLFRKRFEAELSFSVYFCSLSSRTVVYKGLLAPWQLPVFYPDLGSRDFESQFAIFHQRFSTNTQPAWSLAQPFRFLAHNGELNTIVGNRRWMKAREEAIRSSLRAGEWFRALEENVSDSASLDNALEILLQQGHSAESALLTLVPPAFENDPRLASTVRNYLESVAQEHEPWDGPAALAFSDGHVVGAKLDRNGLRPLRYTRTADGWLVVGSEAGIADFSGKKIIERSRLGPGEMLVVDIATGTVLKGSESLRRIAAKSKTITFHQGISLSAGGSDAWSAPDDPRRLSASLGWSDDQIRFLLQPMAGGKEAVWSMGDDTPPAFMSRMRRTLWDYCKQRFAQVTNPPIDPLREAHVMSLKTRIGPDWVCDSPVLDDQQVQLLQERSRRTQRVDATFDVAAGVAGALERLEQLRREVRWNHGSAPELVVLTDRRVSRERAALPILLAASAVWKEMSMAGNFHVPLIIETAQVIDTHHVALLLAVGSTAISPFLAMHMAEDHEAGGATRYRTAMDAGLRKVLSRMGISTLASYRNSQLFEVIGLDGKLCSEFFPSSTRFAPATSLEKVLEGYLLTHVLAFAAEHTGPRDAGLYRFRKDGELHSASPDLMRKLGAYIKAPSSETYHHYDQVGATREPQAIRDLLKFVPSTSVAIADVEPEGSILRRFSTQAMSLGAISAEAHRTLAVAMNRLGGRSNTGEGGEDPDLYVTQPEAVNKVKQVASGRFGVTTEYLVHAEELEIKMAQGSKPGEGGQLPATKVSAYIARLRHAIPGMALISPPPHHDIYSIEDLEQLIHDLREVNPRARIGVKLVAGAGVGVIAAGVAKAGADVITICGHDGGTGASPLSSIKNTGQPWEFGLRETHRILTEAGLRSQVRLRADGGFKFARDVVVAALLGADEFGFGTAALLAIGCVMARQCHLNTCPAGIATQDETLRARFSGNPEMVMSFFTALAGEVRAILARLGARSLDEITGRTEFLVPQDPTGAGWVSDLLQPIAPRPGSGQTRKHQESLAYEIAQTLQADRAPLQEIFPIANADRSIGAGLSGELARRKARLSDSPLIDFGFQGTAGQSFGAFLVPGVNFHLWGEANDYVGKGLSGGTIAISAGEEAARRGDVLAGNTVLYGATSGQLYLAGRAGERFAVRNSGALAVVEGVGDHCSEYMTGGAVIILGPAGINLGSGMTGGLVYMLTQHLTPHTCNLDFVQPTNCSPEEDVLLREVLRRHLQSTGSPQAAVLLESTTLLPFTRWQPLQLPCSIHETWRSLLQGLSKPGRAGNMGNQIPAALDAFLKIESPEVLGA
jgi:glutamate synthase (ferredoxin)